MKVLLMSVGSRGDMEPFLAQAHILRAAGHEVHCAFPEQFRAPTEQDGFIFHSLGSRFLELIEGEPSKQIMSGTGSRWSRMKALWTVIQNSRGIIRELLDLQFRILNALQADRVLYHPKCTLCTIWEMAHPGTCILLSPLPCILHPTERFGTIGIRGVVDRGPFWNRMSFHFTNAIRIISLQLTARKYIRQFKGLKMGFRRIWRSLLHEGKAMYTFSPSVFPAPKIWPEQVKVVGYFERDKTQHWSPDRALIQFLEDYPKPLFISFGSMVNNDPAGKTQILLEVLQKLEIPAIINESWGGLEQPEEHPEFIHFVKNVPYDWLFPQVSAVVHHGGSGTTHTGLKYGCPTLVIPHIVDQFLWNKVIHELGVGPLGVPIEKLKRDSFEFLVSDLYDNKAYREKAAQLANNMDQEHNQQAVLDFVLSPKIVAF
ncbi:MAG: glycosyltransferase [Bacteroidota bacterium]